MPDTPALLLDLQALEANLAAMRARLSEFRRVNRLVDPSGDVAGQTGLLNALQAEPEHKDARLLHARIQLETGDGVAAEAELARARQAGATGAETRHLMAHARLLQNDVDGALQQAAAAAPEQASYAARVIGLAQLRRGDQVVTGGGLLGKVTKVREDGEVEVEIAPGVNVRVIRTTITSVVSRTEPAKA